MKASLNKKWVIGVFVLLAPMFTALASNNPSWPEQESLASNFQYSMEKVFLVKIDGTAITNGEVAAFVNGEIRGVQKTALLFPPTGETLFKLMVYSNLTSGESVTFKVYDENADKFYISDTSLAFVANEKADFSQPLTLNVYCSGVDPVGDDCFPIDSSLIEFPTVLQWTPVKNALKYDLYIWENGTSKPTNPAVTDIYSSSYTLDEGSLVEYGKSYNWTVVARSSCDRSESIEHIFYTQELPDLHVIGINVSASVYSGQEVEIKYTVRNDGNGTTGSNTWNEYVWLHSNPEIRKGDQPGPKLLGTLRNQTFLDAGDEYVQTLNAKIPTDLLGSYFIVVTADMDDILFVDLDPVGGTYPVPYEPSLSGSPYPYLIGWAHGGVTGLIEPGERENSRGDNFFYVNVDIVTPPLPDLVVDKMNFPSTPFSGTDISVSYTIKNAGDAAADKSWYDDIYLSKSDFFDGNAISLERISNHQAIEVDSLSDVTKTLSLPEQSYGKHFLIVKLNSNEGIYEGVNKQNNTYVSDSMNITLSPPPDLEARSLEFSSSVLNNKEEVEIEWTVKNVGTVATGLKAWNDDVYISPVPYFDAVRSIKLKTVRQYKDLGGDSAYTTAISVIIPEQLTGEWYPFVFTDARGEVFEYIFTDNNFYFSDPLSIVQPDLSLSNIVAPSIVTTNQKIDLTWKLVNNGLGDVPSTIRVKDAIYLSKDTIFNSLQDILLDTISWSEEVSSGLVVNKSAKPEIKGALTGEYYLFVVTDVDNKVFENKNVESNVLRAPSVIKIKNPDLSVSVNSVVSSSYTNGEVSISWILSNVGDGLVQNVELSDVIAVSPLSYYSPSSLVIIDTLRYNLSLMPRRSITKEKVIAMPCLYYDSIYVYVVNDANYNLYELDKANNIGVSPTAIDLLKPDLSYTELQVEDSVFCGEDIDISWKVLNTGTSDLQNVSLVDQLYISQSGVFTFTNATLLTSYTTQTFIARNDSLVHNSSFSLPYDFEGDYYLHFVGDAQNVACKDQSFVSSIAVPIHIAMPSLPDFSTSISHVSESIIAGTKSIVSYKVENVGNLNAEGARVDKVFISETSDYTHESAEQIAENMVSGGLLVGDQLQYDIEVDMPTELDASDYFIIVFSNADNGVVETNVSNNTGVSTTNIITYQVNISADTIFSPTKVDAGSTVNVSYTVSNVGMSKTLKSYWEDRVIISPVPAVHVDQMLLSKDRHYGYLNPDDSYTVNSTVEIPEAFNGDYYLYVFADAQGYNNDVDGSNNIVFMGGENPVVISVSGLASPDFDVINATVPNNIVAGQPFMVHYTVKNIGDTIITNKTWNDKVFVMRGEVISDRRELSTNRVSNLNIPIGGEYSDSIECIIPLDLSGFLTLTISVDANNYIFEGDNNGRNERSSEALIELPEPGDLVIRDIDSDAKVTAGQQLKIDWKVVNDSEGQVEGQGLKDIVYLSADSVWDISDKILGEVTSSVSLSAYGAIERTLSSSIVGLKDGEYYIIIKTDVFKRFNETDRTNNTKHSFGTIKVEVPELELNVKESGVLVNNVEMNYKIVIPSTLRNETMRTTLKADSLLGSNQMYMSRNEMPNSIDHQFSHLFAYQGNQELWVPSLRGGNYYMTLNGETSSGASQNYTLLSEILPFGITSVDVAYGGNTGKTTVELKGSKFSKSMGVWLKKGEKLIKADSVVFVDFATAYVTFDLTDAELGWYDIEVLNYCVGTKTLTNAFEVFSGVEGMLGYDLILPENPRPNRLIKGVLEFENIGNTDIDKAFLQVRSLAGCPIALSSEDLSKELKNMIIPLEIEGDRDGVIRPGVRGKVDIYIKTTNGLMFSIKEIKVK